MAETMRDQMWLMTARTDSTSPDTMLPTPWKSDEIDDVMDAMVQGIDDGMGRRGRRWMAGKVGWMDGSTLRVEWRGCTALFARDVIDRSQSGEGATALNLHAAPATTAARPASSWAAHRSEKGQFVGSTIVGHDHKHLTWTTL